MPYHTSRYITFPLVVTQTMQSTVLSKLPYDMHLTIVGHHEVEFIHFITTPVLLYCDSSHRN
jgi:hypothetical protein